MNELSVIVEQSTGLIKWNYEEIKNNLVSMLSDYQNLVYTDDTVKEAKSDLAMLRKLKTSIDSRKKEIKNKCLEPYMQIEQEAKELMHLVDEPICEINTQVNAFEERRKEEKKAEILAYMDEAFQGFNENLITLLKERHYNPSWENKTVKKKEYEEVIHSIAERVSNDFAVIDTFEEEFREEAEKAYCKNAILSEAIMRVNDLREQKKKFLESQVAHHEEESQEEQEVLDISKMEIVEEVQENQDDEYVLEIPMEETQLALEIPTEEEEKKYFALTIYCTESQFTEIEDYIWSKDIVCYKTP